MGLIELAERCEQATGPDRELDAAIAVSALGFYIAEPRYHGAPIAYGYMDENGNRVEPGHGGKQLIREFTASLDAALTLVPEDAFWRLGHDGAGADPSSFLAQVLAPGVAGVKAIADTPALAMCAAALRARAAE